MEDYTKFRLKRKDELIPLLENNDKIFVIGQGMMLAVEVAGHPGQAPVLEAAFVAYVRRSVGDVAPCDLVVRAIIRRVAHVVATHTEKVQSQAVLIKKSIAQVGAVAHLVVKAGVFISTSPPTGIVIHAHVGDAAGNIEAVRAAIDGR